jgi:hypothetical protein
VENFGMSRTLAARLNDLNAATSFIV